MYVFFYSPGVDIYARYKLMYNISSFENKKKKFKRVEEKKK